ncbi:hypothetical protein F4678DRAFT_469034 [Xylaria arbuscula]|nr:hypothetical protein F4678DRAFT_469034 [Xylaria arbuscula]
MHACFYKKYILIFVFMHTWQYNFNCKVPGIFFYAQGMPVVINKNIYTRLKVVNKAEFIAVDIIPDFKYLGYYFADDVTIHFGPPLGILLQSIEIKNLTIPSLLPGTVLIRLISHTVDLASFYFRFLSRKCTRQGKTFMKVLLKLRGNRVTNGQPSKCDFTSFYVQLFRCRTLQGIKLLSLIRQQDFIGNKLDQTIVDAMQRLRKLADDTRRMYKA